MAPLRSFYGRRGEDLGDDLGAERGADRGAALGAERGAALGAERGAALVGVRDGTRTLGRGDEDRDGAVLTEDGLGLEMAPRLGVVLRSRVGRPVPARLCPVVVRTVLGDARPVGFALVVVRRPAVLGTARPVEAPLVVVRLP